MSAGWLAIIGLAIRELLAAIFGSRRDAQNQATSENTHERLGATEASNETQQVIAETAAARADLPPEPDSDDALVAELRNRAARKRALGSDSSSGQLAAGGTKGGDPT